MNPTTHASASNVGYEDEGTDEEVTEDGEYTINWVFGECLQVTGSDPSEVCEIYQTITENADI